MRTGSGVSTYAASGRSKGTTFDLDIPTTHSLVTKSYLAKLKIKSDKFDSLLQLVNRKRYNATKYGSKMIGFAASLVPQCGYYGFSTIIPFIIASFLTDAGVTFDKQALIQSLPSPQTIQNLITDIAVDSVMLTQQSLRHNPIVYLTCDKGDKKGNKNLAKLLCWYVR